VQESLCKRACAREPVQESLCKRACAREREREREREKHSEKTNQKKVVESLSTPSITLYVVSLTPHRPYQLRNQVRSQSFSTSKTMERYIVHTQANREAGAKAQRARIHEESGTARRTNEPTKDRETDERQTGDAMALTVKNAHVVGGDDQAQLFYMVPDHWRPLLREYYGHYRFRHLASFLRNETAFGRTSYPYEEHVFEALAYCRLDQGPATRQGARAAATGGGCAVSQVMPNHIADVAVVILGQDPYPGNTNGLPHAHGLAFSVSPGIYPPPSLLNIFVEVYRDLKRCNPPVTFTPSTGCLRGWARQGVLLLNSILTVSPGKPMSHADSGWVDFTDAIIRIISKQSARPLVFLLWGRQAQSKACLIEGKNRHLILSAAHPSPHSASRGFFNCRHFSKTNEFLVKNRYTPIDWNALE